MNDQTEKHFQMCIYLMLFFFCACVGLELLKGLKILEAPEAFAMAKESFNGCAFVALGMFRGMLPQGKS